MTVGILISTWLKRCCLGLGAAILSAEASDVLLMPKDADYSEKGLKLVDNERFSQWDKAETSVKQNNIEFVFKAFGVL